jgi:hypothetical protein
MSDDASAADGPTPEPACEKCGGTLEQLNLPKFDHGQDHFAGLNSEALAGRWQIPNCHCQPR